MSEQEVLQTQNDTTLKGRVLKGFGLATWVVVNFLLANLLVGLIFAML